MTWATLDGRKLREESMSDSHLVNALRFLVRQRQEEMYGFQQYQKDLRKAFAGFNLTELQKELDDPEAKLCLSDRAEELGFLDLAQYLRGFMPTYRTEEAIEHVTQRYRKLVKEARKRGLESWKES